MGAYHKLGSPENYTIGGLRFFFNELIGSQYQGHLYLGNVVTGGLTPSVDNLDHFTAKSGKRLKDRRVTREIGMAFNFTLDEPNASAMNMFMFGAGVSDAAASVAVAVVNAPAVIDDKEPVTLPEKGVTAIVVTKGVTSLVLNTDYTVVDLLGYKQIKRITSSVTCANGDAIEIDYTYSRSAHRLFKPATRTLREGSAVIHGVSDIGNEFVYEVPKCSLAPSGDFTFNDQDWSQFQFSLEILDNSSVDVASPFGAIRHFGTGEDV